MRPEGQPAGRSGCRGSTPSLWQPAPWGWHHFHQGFLCLQLLLPQPVVLAGVFSAESAWAQLGGRGCAHGGLLCLCPAHGEGLWVLLQDLSLYMCWAEWGSEASKLHQMVDP